MSHGEEITIFGYGRFGALLAELLKGDFSVKVFDPSASSGESSDLLFCDLAEALSSPVLFYAVPISQFEGVLCEHLRVLSEQSSPPKLFIDLLSVKTHPKAAFQKHLRKSDSAILTHPMFGPDSVRENGLEGQRMVMENLSAEEGVYGKWRDYFLKLGLEVIEMNAEDHDRLAANSQCLTHFIGRVLGEFGFTPTRIDTLGAERLKAIVDQTCNDTWELFSDLQKMNPYTLPMRVQLGKALETVYARLLPKRQDEETLSIGIQGGKGSFNEEAALYYLKRSGIESFRLAYLHTTARVLSALHEGEIDCGQFAIHNSTGGVVQESIEAMAEYRFEIKEQFSIKICHALMAAPGAALADIDTVMTHPQVLKQCKRTLEEKYPRLKLTSGEGELIDHAEVARHLSESKLPGNIAVMGSKILAEIYGLHLIEENLQDLENNFTSFLWVERPSA